MFVVFCGNDQIEVRKQAHRYIDESIHDDQLVIKLEADNYEPGQLTNFTQANVLFGLTPLYLIDTASLHKDFYDELLGLLDNLASAPSTFVVVEKELLAAEKKKFAKHAEKINEYKKTSDARFNPFVMADALARKDKRLLWVLLQEARQNNLVAEEIIGTLWWQLKTLRLAALTSSAQEAGVKDYPYNKAKQALRNFKLGEIEKISAKLLKLYHESHAGRRDIDMALEEWVLGI
ncbi:MAG: hypothetical protein H6779_02755 [Candidatus Nomurabacteria bacterium]|nr:hypothetical protein [Candidatus Nomurabacteria bacterium]USN87309.1 MAG: hypothetical protein H6779_02755 [Candidatus Nomurabacteria bacterium]